MSKQGVTTNLLGRRARITFGVSDEKIKTWPHNELESEFWKNLGAVGEITAVYKEGDGLKVSLEMENGKILEPYLSHLTLLPKNL